jgi:hypothetical protein
VTDPALHERLVRLGLRGVREVRTHQNRVVMLSLRGGVLRIHAGYAAAPDGVLEAVVRYLRPWARRATRQAAQEEFLAFPVERHAPSRERRRRPARVLPGDAPLLERLREAHRRLNAVHFGGALADIPIRISTRMRTRLGEVSLDRLTGAAEEIGMSRRHLRQDPWAEVEHTLLHEMVHQWQAETGRAVDHGAGFRRKAREVGVLPRARRPAGAATAPRFERLARQATAP